MSDSLTQVPDPVPVAVIGVGRMGRHHARTYSKIAHANLLAVVDLDIERAATVADEFDCEAVSSVDELLAKFPQVKAVSVAAPTVYHSVAARPLLERGVACLVEKPLAPTLAEAQALAHFADEHKAVLQVGHTERFNPAVRAVAAMDITPRFIEITRVSPMTFRSLDVGVVMDMMIHDLDIVLMLVKSPLVSVEAAGVAVIGSHEDVANARLVFKSGCVATFTASRLALKTDRRLRLFSEQAYVSLDYQARSGIVMGKSRNVKALEEVRRLLAAGADLSDMNYHEMIDIEELTMDLPPGEDDPLTAELTSFLAAAAAGRAPVVDGAAGYAAVDAAERVVKAIANHKWEGLSGSLV